MKPRRGRHGREPSTVVTVKPALDAEVNRLVARSQFLFRKAQRMPIGNGKRKALKECEMLAALASTLANPPAHREKGRKYVGSGSRDSERAVNLLNELVPERAL